MSSDFESYEQDFAVLTAEVTGRIGKVPKLVGGIFARSLLLHHQKFQLVLVEMAGSSSKGGYDSKWEGDMRRHAHEVAFFSSSDLREIADGLLPPPWKKQDERCKNWCYFCIRQRDLLKSSD